MKPVYLEFCGVNSFSEKAEINFSELLAGGVFGIFGDTGSGKSTILDCIHLALYGVIERSTGAINDCINYNSDGAYVVFDFEITTGGERHTYRVRRERKRKPNSAKAYLYEYVDGALVALCEGPKEVNPKIEEIIGLNFNDFKMCIALPQGDFSALVKAQTSERVKLVARLFDLEKYGERLAKAAYDKYNQADEEVRLVLAKMGQNEGGDPETIESKQKEIEGDKLALKEAESRVKRADENYEKAATLKKEKQEYEEDVRQLNGYMQHAADMEKKRAEAERLPMAKAVKRAAEAWKKSQEEQAEAEKKLSIANNNVKAATLALDKAKAEREARDFDKEIVDVSVALDKVKGAQADIDEEKDAKEQYNQCVAQYKTLKAQCADKDFAKIAEDLEKQLEALGEDETLMEYLKNHCKDMLLPDVYEEVRGDLQTLANKHTCVQADVADLLKKYTLAGNVGGTFDVEKEQQAFREIERKRKALKKNLEDIAKEKLTNESILGKMKIVEETGRMHKERYNRAVEKNKDVKALGERVDLERKLDSLQKAKRLAEEAVESAQKKLNGYLAEADTQKGLLEVHQKSVADGKEALREALAENGFASVEEAVDLLYKLGDEEKVKTECKAFFDKLAFYKHKVEKTDAVKFASYSEESLEAARQEKLSAGQERDEVNRKIAAGEAELARLIALQKKYQEFEKELAEKEKRKKLCGELKESLKNNRFLEFIASEYLQEICAAASKTLLSLTNGKYFLRYEKDFKVGDNLNCGNLRAVKTLSGGETFLVSLALALSLSGAICQKSLRPIEFFFLDEGFGTLDEKLVDTVMDVLAKLSKSFAVGLISHVEELKHRIDNKIIVTGATETHGSQAKIEKF